ncbi:hypothetical protein Aperf_G00000081071 [Anoplocephala perfoliata]
MDVFDLHLSKHLLQLNAKKYLTEDDVSETRLYDQTTNDHQTAYGFLYDGGSSIFASIFHLSISKNATSLTASNMSMAKWIWRDKKRHAGRSSKEDFRETLSERGEHKAPPESNIEKWENARILTKWITANGNRQLIENSTAVKTHTSECGERRANLKPATAVKEGTRERRHGN